MNAPRSSLLLPRVIVGLGNPGEKYADTRHNAGFLVVDRVLAKLKKTAEREHRHDSEIFRVGSGGRALVLVKPLTFMNLSGEAVAKVKNATGADPAEILVVYDCLDLPLGRIRLRTGGGSGGHRGVESVIQALGSDAFPRVRVGIGRGDQTVVDYVLGGWSDEEQPIMDEAVTAAADAVILAIRAGMETAMNRFNGWRGKAAPADNPKPAGESGT